MSRARWRILQPVLVFSDTQHKGFDERRGTSCRLLKEGVSTIGRPGLHLFAEMPRRRVFPETELPEMILGNLEGIERGPGSFGAPALDTFTRGGQGLTK
jgi:hypothetical protein